MGPPPGGLHKGTPGRARKPPGTRRWAPGSWGVFPSPSRPLPIPRARAPHPLTLPALAPQHSRQPRGSLLEAAPALAAGKEPGLHREVPSWHLPRAAETSTPRCGWQGPGLTVAAETGGRGLGGSPCVVRDPQKLTEKCRGVSGGGSLREGAPALGSACSWASRKTTRRSLREGDFLPWPLSAWENYLPLRTPSPLTLPASSKLCSGPQGYSRWVCWTLPIPLLSSPGLPASGPGPQTAPTGWKGVSGPPSHSLAPPAPGQGIPPLRPAPQPSDPTHILPHIQGERGNQHSPSLLPDQYPPLPTIGTPHQHKHYHKCFLEKEK